MSRRLALFAIGAAGFLARGCPEFGTACGAIRDCPDGLACVAGRCTVCALDADCGPSLVCDHQSCAPPTVVRGRVVDSATSVPIGGARVLVVDPRTDAVVAPAVTSAADGTFAVNVPVVPGETGLEFHLRAGAAGYLGYPVAPARPPDAPHVLLRELGDPVELRLIREPAFDGSFFIEGGVESSGMPVLGALVVATQGVAARSGLSDAEGRFRIDNVGAGDWSVVALRRAFNQAASVTATVAGSPVVGLALSVDPVLGGSVDGTLAFGGVTAPAVVALAHPLTGEVVPNTATAAATAAFAIAGAPDGTFDVVAALGIDGKVAAPDPASAAGLPSATVVGATGAVSQPIAIVAPIAPAPPWTPPASAPVLAFRPADPVTFGWLIWPGADRGYAIEVTDARGTVVWGGFDATGCPMVALPPAATSLGYAGTPLVAGMAYRWRLWALAADAAGPCSGIRFLSVTEPERGGFEIGP